MENALSGRRLWQVAGAIRDRLHAVRLSRFHQAQGQIQGLASDLAELESVRRRLDLCVARGWTAAAGSLMEQATRLFRSINYMSKDAELALNKPEVAIPNVRDVLEELLQAEVEFERLRYYPEDQILAVVTDAVELEGVYLGDFEVQLHIPALGDPNFRSLYRVMALDPHPSSRNDSVTHPHISEERLCAGDAGAAIDTALAGGRICDFFILVRSVLTNYNRDSAYVTLEDWDGAACHGFTRASAASIAWRRRAWASSSESKNSTSMAITSLSLLQELPQPDCFELGLPNVPLDLSQLRRKLVQARLEGLQVDLQHDDRCDARSAGLYVKF